MAADPLKSLTEEGVPFLFDRGPGPFPLVRSTPQSSATSLPPTLQEQLYPVLLTTLRQTITIVEGLCGEISDEDFVTLLETAQVLQVDDHLIWQHVRSIQLGHLEKWRSGALSATQGQKSDVAMFILSHWYVMVSDLQDRIAAQRQPS